MTQQTNRTMYSTANLTEVNRLLNHIESTAIDSEQTPVTPGEIPVVADAVVKRLVLGNSCLDQLVQEELDELRFRE